MKKLLLVLCIAAVLLMKAAPVASGPTNVTLAWDYDTNSVTPDLVFKLYSTTNINIPMSSWPLMTNIPGTNLTWILKIQPGNYFFVLTASNFWGESGFSNTAMTPPVPKSSTNTSIKLGP